MQRAVAQAASAAACDMVETVESAEFFDRKIDCGDNCLWFARVARKRSCGTSQCSLRGLHIVGIASDDDDPCAGGDAGLGGRATHSRRAADDDDGLVFEHWVRHGLKVASRRPEI